MKICMVPEANLKAVRNAVESLMKKMDPDVVYGGQGLRGKLNVALCIVQDVLDGPMNAERRRANRGMLEEAFEQLKFVVNAVQVFREWSDVDEEAEAMVKAVRTYDPFVMEMALDHLGPAALDLWETDDV